MKIKFVDSYSWCIGWFVVVSLALALGLGGGCWLVSFVSSVKSFGAYFVVDSVSYYLSVLSILLGGSLFFVSSQVSVRSLVMVGLSVVCSVLCYMSVNVLIFWVFYEVSILALFYLLLSDSPYSERYIAGWYLLGYVVLTSLPMLLCILFMSVECGSLSMIDWGVWGDFSGDYVALLLVLGVMFVTKVPVPPFHVWLPIVHAEASSIVSVCLSGYIMKLGLLGVCRLCFFVVSDSLFFSGYVVCAFSLAVLFFVAASRELDGKRWLAFLSLAHILVCVVCFYVGGFSVGSMVFLYSLGHGLSAGLLFVLLWWAYELSGSRNWVVLKSVLGGSRLLRVIVIGGLCTAASLPPMLQFFVEVCVLSETGCVSVVLFLLLCSYLFVGSLVPFFLLGGLLTRHFSIGHNDGLCVSGVSAVVVFYIIWSFVVFVVI